MKNLKLLSSIGIFALFFSCSNDDDSNLQLSWETISGDWRIKEVINADGTKVPYINLCSSTPDKVKIYGYPKMEFYYHSPNCFEGIEEQCDDFTFSPENRTIGHCDDLINGEVTTLTRTIMQIDYNEERSFPFDYNNLNIASGIVLEKIE